MDTQNIFQEDSDNQVNLVALPEENQFKSLWNQLGPICQIQLAQQLAEMIQRMRENLHQEMSSDENL